MEDFRFAQPYELPRYTFVPPAELGGGEHGRHPVVIVGAGLAGLTLACELAHRGVRSVLVDEDDTVGVRGASSRGICYAQKTLEIFDCLGIYERMATRGVNWCVGRTFSGQNEVYTFDLDAQSVSRQPPFLNLQQFYVEGFLVERLQELALTDLRWCSRVVEVQPQAGHVRLKVETPAGSYWLEADHLVDATGANSPVRTQLGIEAHASRSPDRWCITDVRFTKGLPAERWTWVDAPFNGGRAVWQHPMADDVWRMDYQMPQDADLEQIARPEVAGGRLREQLGPDVDFEFVWIGPYQYRDHLLDDFRYGRLFFIGDSAHVVSPFGARGGNTGIQDAFNLGWKLALRLAGQVDDAFLDSFSAERHAACAENLQVTSRSARFLAPRSAAEHTLRGAVLALAREHAFARSLVNTGRMSVANAYPPSAWLPQGARSVQNLALARPGGESARLMDLLRGAPCFLALWLAPGAGPLGQLRSRIAADQLPLRVLAVGGEQPDLLDPDGALARHLGGDPLAGAGTAFLVRPDAYLGATLPRCTPDVLVRTLSTLLGRACAATP